MIVVDDVVAKNASKKFCRANDHSICVDAQRIVADGNLRGGKLEGDNILDNKANYCQYSERVVSEQIENRYVVVLFLVLVLGVLFLDALQLCQFYIMFYSIGCTHLIQGEKGVFRTEVGKEVEGCFLDVED